MLQLVAAAWEDSSLTFSDKLKHIAHKDQRMHKVILSCVIVLFAASALSAQTKPRNWLDGVWEVTGYQIDDNSTWTMKLTARGGRYTIEYPSLKCSGRWIRLSFVEGHAVFRERITEGLSECVDHGRVVIQRLSRRQVAYRFSYRGSGEISASAILNRQK